MEQTPTHRSLSIDGFLNSLISDKKALALRIANSFVAVDMKDFPAHDFSAYCHRRGIFSLESLAEILLSGMDLGAEADKLGISRLQLALLAQHILDKVDPAFRQEVEFTLQEPAGLGQIDWTDPDNEPLMAEWGLDKIRKVNASDVIDTRRPWPPVFVPRGPLQAVDLRPFLGDARNQGGRGSCYAFAATAIAEAMEGFRDNRPRPRDFSEQMTFWYSKQGQLHTSGGGDSTAALINLSEYGCCEEFFLPYSGTGIPTNHVQVPVADNAIDNAQFYRTGEVVELPSHDVQAVKDVLRSGRCVAFNYEADYWLKVRGEFIMPEPPDSWTPHVNHASIIIGYIDRDDLPETFEGGYFIVRNSHGHANSPDNVMGSEYGGHLRMPYGWYRRYTAYVSTVLDPRGEGDEADWLVEYFANPSLRGEPERTVSVNVGVSFFEYRINVPVPVAVSDVDFHWGPNSALRYELSSPRRIVDLLPADNFSVRFTKLSRLRNGWYRFKLSGDDGIRLYVDDRLVINAWKNQAETEYVAEHYVTGGDHILRVEYYEKTGQAAVKLDIEPINFHYQLFENTTASGTARAIFDDTLTNLEWRHAPPLTSMENGQFSLRGAAELHFKEGDYRFHAIHTGGCRITVDGIKVLDDWDGASGSGAVQSISEGMHEVEVIFKHTELVPPLDAFGFYRAALSFGWTEHTWQASFYSDPEREAISTARWPNPDSLYEGLRTQSLTGAPLYEHRYSASHDVESEYFASDGLPLRIRFNNPAEFGNGIWGAPDLDQNFISAHVRRKFFIEEDGYYNVKFGKGAGSRVIIDGKELLEDHVSGLKITNDDIYLKSGVHDLAIEWAITKSEKTFDFILDRVKWDAKYYTGTDFDSLVSETQINDPNDIVSQRPASLGNSHYSVKVSRSLSLPVGKYRFLIKTDDGARLRLNHKTCIDAWFVQRAAAYEAEIEHHGGNLFVEIDYYQNAGTAVFEYNMDVVGFFGEYYQGTTLNKVESGSVPRINAPIAYRFEPSINFDWGGGNRLDRVGASNFSARWHGRLDLPVGRWRFDITADDGVRLYVDGRLLVDRWKRQSATNYSHMIDLVGRKHDIKVEYFELTGNAVCKLSMARIL